ncbi:carbon storage regulator [Klenkia terrae]|uniref:carbon storage regulator n=1 Tax=Klenkia terrae TaxID=1052259 RepID=UPI00360E2F6A
MLTLTRNIGETIRIGDDIEVHVVEVRGNTVRLGFKAPARCRSTARRSTSRSPRPAVWRCAWPPTRSAR